MRTPYRISRPHKGERTLSCFTPPTCRFWFAHLNRHPSGIFRRSQRPRPFVVGQNPPSDFGEKWLANVEMPESLTGCRDALLRGISCQRHSTCIEVQTETLLGNGVHQLYSLGNCGHEIATVILRVRLNTKAHA